MVSEIRVYFEGDRKLKPGFRDFLDSIFGKARQHGSKIELVSGGPKSETIQDFMDAVAVRTQAFNVLIVDSDEPFTRLLALGMVLQDGVKMSKSAGDAGDPQHLLDRYGADAVRMAMMFAAPPEHSFEWSEHGVESANRWLRNRLWHAVDDHLRKGNVPDLKVASLTSQQKELRRLVHETIAKAGDDYGRRLTFNTVISSVMSLMNLVDKFKDDSPQGSAVMREALNAVIVIMSPITPHISHELWQKMNDGKFEDVEWLTVDESALEKTLITMVVQVNGKLRGKFEIAPDASKDEMEQVALRVENVDKFLNSKTIRKVIVVPNKLVNFVVS